MTNIALDALIEVTHLMGAPVGCYSDDLKVMIYEDRVQTMFTIAHRVISVLLDTSAAVPLPASPLYSVSQNPLIRRVSLREMQDTD